MRVLNKVLILVFCLFICSCGKTERVKNQLVFGLDNDPKNLDPRLALDAVSERIAELVYSSLLKKDRNSELLLDLAESWEMKGDRVYIFHLKKNVKFHDGTALTASDVKYTFDSIIDPNFKSPKRGAYEALESVEIMDELTVKFTLKRPFAPFLTNMVMGIVPEGIDSRKDINLSEHPVGSGPFEFVSWKRAQSIVLKKNSQYFASKPKLDSIKFKVIQDATVRILELENGNIDILQNGVIPDLLDRLRKNKDLRVEEYTGSNYVYMGFNYADPILKNTLVRNAIAHAIDRKKIIHYLLRDLATPAESLLPPSNWAFRKPTKPLTFDPELSKSLLDKAGFKLKTGEKTRFKLLLKTSQNEQTQKIAEILQEQLKDVGIDLDIKRFEWGTFFDDIKKGNFQLYCLTWVGVTEPDIYHYIFHSSSIPPNGANRGRYKNNEIDKLLLEGRNTLNQEERIKIYAKVQEILSEEKPYISLWYEKNVIVRNKKVKNFIPFPAGDFYSLVDVSKEE